MEYERRLKIASDIILSVDQDENSPEYSSSVVLNLKEWGVTANLKPHQVEGLSWLIRRYKQGVNVILGDEMGLGKTLQAISFLSYLRFSQNSTGAYLVLCPLSVVDGWMSEFTSFAPNLKVLSYLGDKTSRRALRKEMLQKVREELPNNNTVPYDVIVTTYDIIMLDQDFLSQIPWQYAIIDEAQRLKNSSSVLYTVLQSRFLLPRRLLVTGTPIQNNLSELWALLHFCMPLIFGTKEEFLLAFRGEGNDDGLSFKRLRHIIRAFMLRRTKSMLVQNGVLNLPRLTEINVMTPLVQLQKKVYVSILRKELTKIVSSSGSSSPQILQNIVMQLRKACSHPYLFNGIEPEPFIEGEHLVEASGKLIILDKLLQKLHAEQHRVLLFAQMTHTLDILQDFLEMRKYTYERLDGSVRAQERFAAIKNFSHHVNDLEPQVGETNAFVFMISTRAGGVGLNLIGADTVIFYEQDWNPQVDKQALQRAHRIGQNNPVLSINLVTPDTIEEVIMRRAASKLQLSENVTGGDDASYDWNKLGVKNEDLRSSITFGLNKLDPSDVLAEDSTNVGMVDEMVEKVLDLRNKKELEGEDRKFEINPTEFTIGEVKNSSSASSATLAPELDESSYLSWLEKFKDAHLPIRSSNGGSESKKRVSETKLAEIEAEKKRKTEEKKLSKWESLGYESLAVVPPDANVLDNFMSESGSVEFVFGDCTHPEKYCPLEPTLIFSCVDDSGVWGRGGMFDALARLSPRVVDIYSKASECQDLHLGDLHLVDIEGTDEESKSSSTGSGAAKWVALSVVQSYNPRRKVPRSGISMPHLEQCILKSCYAAAQKSASIHMPRIGYQDRSGHSEWYVVERLLRKYASTFGVKIFVYYFRHTG